VYVDDAVDEPLDDVVVVAVENSTVFPAPANERSTSVTTSVLRSSNPSVGSSNTSARPAPASGTR